MNSTGPLCCLRLINDSRYLPEDKFTKVQRCTQLRESNKSFVQIYFLDIVSELKTCWKVTVKALQNIKFLRKVVCRV